MAEKRRYHRMEVGIPVSFELDEAKSLIMSTTLDISATGLSLILKEPLEVGRLLALTVCVDNDRMLKISARVVRIKEIKKTGEKEYLAGLKIIDKMDQDEIEFVRFVAKQMIEQFAVKKEAPEEEAKDGPFFNLP